MIELKTDSRKVKPGDTFIAIKNVNTDGHDFIESAIKNGATKIICEKGSYSVETVVVPNTKEYLNNYLYENYYPKIKDMKLIGVTGTNGKTTICYLVYQLLTLLGKKCAYIGTIGFYYGNTKRLLNNTTPDTDLLYDMLLEAKEYGCEYVVMEVSSHALDKNRVFGLEFDEVAFTNLTQDHLDYHKTLENYANAKRKLFEKTRGEKVAIINKDDPHHEKFMLNENNNITIGKNDADVLIKDYSLSHLHTKIEFSYEDKIYNTQINMVGSYNVYNYLTALMLVNKLGFSIDSIIDITKDLMAPAGRMEMIKYNTNSVFVDYAHTPDAVINVLKSANEYKKGKIIKGTEIEFDVDTLLLSVGLIPENELSTKAGIDKDIRTNGLIVSESMETSIRGVFACGNVLHVHDLVDFVTEEAKRAGRSVAKYLRNELDYSNYLHVKNGKSIKYVIPQKINIQAIEDNLTMLMRVDNIYHNKKIVVKCDETVIAQFNRKHLAPSEMEKVIISKSIIEKVKGDLVVSLEDGE